MTQSLSGGLSKLTIVSPRRRLDVALPADLPVAQLLSLLLRNLGEGLADDGQSHRGWVLRRPAGDLIDPAKSLGAQAVRDGEILHLVPRQQDWEALDYDDVVDSIAFAARRQFAAWGPAATHRAGLAGSGIALALGLWWVLRAGPPWDLPSGFALGVAALLLAGAAGLARAAADSVAATVVAVFGSLYAFVGGMLLLGGERPLTALLPTSYLLGSACLLLASLAGFVIVGQHLQYFTAGITVGLVGVGASLAGRATFVTTFDAAAVTLAVAIGVTPWLPLVAVRVGKLPMPSLPTSTEDLLSDPPQPPITRVRSTVRRADEVLTGLLLATMVVGLAGMWIISSRASLWATILLLLVSAVFLLRARLLRSVRHRLPILITGLAGLGFLAVRLVLSSEERSLALPSLLVLMGACLVGIGITYARARPSPLLGRAADIIEVILVLAVVPVVCVVIGLVAYLRGIYG
ncbi:type VII secretion integral membrane protein EccD [Blastococcus sp. Marseille-P5729]|uniref:type VII secretion integral membrane protein EccD n=1 Tax=Blastococcus sp. Marseille-P5729 TaxID=2086582 RepID=UPI00131C208E|nr:type VII secretion integral membrane protein EccD [Blastococcus sp. Marseille-P5729]